MLAAANMETASSGEEDDDGSASALSEKETPRICCYYTAV
jgi:hypothetical protein